MADTRDGSVGEAASGSQDRLAPDEAAPRTVGPVRCVRFSDGVQRWVVSRHDDALAALSDPRLSSELPEDHAEVGHASASASASSNGRTLINLDPPGHTRIRKLVVKYFSAKRIESLRPLIQRVTDELLDAMEDQDRVDIIESLAFPLPLQVICGLLGITDEDRNSLRRLPCTQPNLLDDQTLMEEFAARTDEMQAVMAELMKARREHPADDLTSDLVNAPGAEQISDSDVLQTLVLLLIAGHMTSVHMIITGTLALLRYPDQLAAVRDDPSLLPAAIDEILRYDGPVNPGVDRYALEDVEIGGVTIPKGSYVLIALTTANHDPSKFSDPEQLNIHRSDNDHIAFGHGIHYCVGARLAQVEGEIAIGTLLRRFPDLALAVPAEDLHWRLAFARDLQELPVILRAT